MENRGNDGIWELRVLSTCSVNSQNFPRFARIYWKKMENRGKDWIWQVSRINSTCRMNFQNVPCFSIIHWKKWKIWVNLIRCGKSIWYILVGGWFIRIYSFSVVLIPCRKKKMELWYYPLVGWIVTIYPVFLELIQEMENWDEDWI